MESFTLSWGWGGGRGAKCFGPAIFLFCSPPLLINDQSLTSKSGLTGQDHVGNGEAPGAAGEDVEGDGLVFAPFNRVLLPVLGVADKDTHQEGPNRHQPQGHGHQLQRQDRIIIFITLRKWAAWRIAVWEYLGRNTSGSSVNSANINNTLKYCYYPPEVSSMTYCCLGVFWKEYFRLVRNRCK